MDRSASASRPAAVAGLVDRPDSNAYEAGFTAAWDGLRHAYWKQRTPETEKALKSLMDPRPSAILPARPQAAGADEP